MELLDNPVTDGEPVTGVCNGRMVAYWPSEEDGKNGLRAPDGTYIPAVIVSAWTAGHAVPTPCVNLRLFTDGLNVPDTAPQCLGSRNFSLQPAKGCWTWIPKA